MAQQCDGSVSQRIDFGACAAAQNLTNKSIAFWLYVSSIASSDIVARFGSGATDEDWLVGFIGSGAFQFAQHFSTADGIWFSPNSSVIINTLTHIVITYNDSAVGNKPSMYVNAVSKSVTTNQAPVGTVRSGTTNVIRVGSRTTGASLTGKIQDLRIYNRILSAAEISALYASSRTLEMNDAGLVLHCPLMYAANLYPTVPFAGVLSGTSYTYDRINGYQGTPTGSPTGAADLVYGTSF